MRAEQESPHPGPLPPGGRGRNGEGRLQITSVVRVARWVIRRGIQRIEAMVFILDLRPIGDSKSNLAKTANDVLSDLGKRMQSPDLPSPSRQREICRLLRHRRLEFQLRAPAFQKRIELSFCLIDQLTHSGSLVFRQSP